GFRMFAGRATTSPSTSTTVSPVRPPAIRRTSSGALGPTATCTRPARSRRSMNTIPPRSRRRCTHPPKRTRCPACWARSSPQRSVRRDVRLTLLMLPPPRTRRDRTLRATWRRAAGRAPAPAARGARCGSTPSRALPPRIRGRPRGRTGAPARRRSSRTAPARGSFRPPPPALSSSGAAAFWNPAQPAIPARASLAFEVIETAPTVGASGVIATARVRVRPLGHVGLVYGRMGIGDLVRTSLSPDPDPGTIPYYTQTLGATWSSALGGGGTALGATLAYQQTQLDAEQSNRWTLDVGARRSFSDA